MGLKVLKKHISELQSCNLCKDMIGPVVVGKPALSQVLLIGQAPGVKEGSMGKPFAWTAGKTLFRWFDSIGINEEDFRELVYMAAVCRCFPGKNPKGGDRVPNKDEIENCSYWLESELKILSPRLIIPVGKLAILQLLNFDKLTEVIGKKHTLTRGNKEIEVIPLPHPSGASTWHRMEPGKSLLSKALKRIKSHNSFKSLLKDNKVNRGSLVR